MLTQLTRKLHEREAGFTLIELMIVILVILILAAILVPQFGLARERARKASCVSNQRNLETAVAMWSTDNPTAVYVGGQLTVSTPSAAQLTSAPQYALAGALIEPDDSAVTSGADYFLSMGSAAAPANQSAPSYGHVACWFDGVADAWVAAYDGTGGGGKGLYDHRRGSAASP